MVFPSTVCVLARSKGEVERARAYLATAPQWSRASPDRVQGVFASVRTLAGIRAPRLTWQENAMCVCILVCTTLLYNEEEVYLFFDKSPTQCRASCAGVCVQIVLSTRDSAFFSFNAHVAGKFPFPGRGEGDATRRDTTTLRPTARLGPIPQGRYPRRR